jgi:CheY-like chemotaxis protein
MIEITKWLREIEQLANKVYLQAASIHADDPRLKKFLEDIAEDEAWHYHVMGSAKEYLASIPAIVPTISIDKETNDKIIGYFSDIQVSLEKKSCSINELIKKIVKVELSEFNDIFIYVVNFLKDKSCEFKYPAARIQAHIKKIQSFLEGTDIDSEALKQITELAPVWVENILIVDNEQIITDLLRAILNRSGNIDIAHNGQEALKLIGEKYYKLIISDTDMPIMDGPSLFKEAVKKFPKLINRFLFITGDITNKRQAFFRENQVKYLAKPMEIGVLREVASEIILSK